MSPTAPTVFQYPDGWMEFVPVAGGFKVGLRPRLSGGFIALDNVDTWFPPEVVRQIAVCHGFAWTGEVIARHQDPGYLERILKRQLFSYFPPSTFTGKRILDFGCGTGASTFCLSRLLPDCQITGVDFDTGPYRRRRAHRPVVRRPKRVIPSISFAGQLAPGNGHGGLHRHERHVSAYVGRRA